jgi:thiol-disulfide isomerase/thioredoxin
MSVQKVNDTEFAEILSSKEKVVVKYYADWCGSCRLIAPKYNRMSEEEKNQEFTFLEVNAEESPEARKLAGVSNLPFFAIFKNGQLQQADFTAKPETVESMIDSLR